MSGINANLPFFHADLSENPRAAASVKRKLSSTFDPRKAKKAKLSQPQLPDEVKARIVNHLKFDIVSLLPSLNKEWNEWAKKNASLFLSKKCCELLQVETTRMTAKINRIKQRLIELKSTCPSEEEGSEEAQELYFLQRNLNEQLAVLTPAALFDPVFCISKDFPLISLQLLSKIPNWLENEKGFHALQVLLPRLAIQYPATALKEAEDRYQRIMQESLSSAPEWSVEMWNTSRSLKGDFSRKERLEKVHIFENLVKFSRSLTKEFTPLIGNITALLKQWFDEQEAGYYPHSCIFGCAYLVALTDIPAVENIADRFLGHIHSLDGFTHSVRGDAIECYCAIASLLYATFPDKFWQLMESLVNSQLFKAAGDLASDFLLFLARKDAEKALAFAHLCSGSSATTTSTLEERLTKSPLIKAHWNAFLLDLVIQRGSIAEEAKGLLDHTLNSCWSEKEEESLIDFLQAAKALAACDKQASWNLLETAAAHIGQEMLTASNVSRPLAAFLEEACILSCQYFPEHSEKWRFLLKTYWHAKDCHYTGNVQQFVSACYAQPAAQIAHHHPELLDPILQDFARAIWQEAHATTRYVSYITMARALAAYRPGMATFYLNSAIRLREQGRLYPRFWMNDEYRLLFTLKPEEAGEKIWQLAGKELNDHTGSNTEKITLLSHLSLLTVKESALWLQNPAEKQQPWRVFTSH